MKKPIKSFVGRASMVMMLIVVMTSCDLFKLDINTDPRSPSTASPDLILPNAIASASTTFEGGFNRNIHGFMGMMTSADDFNLTTSSFSGTWTALYPGPLKDLETIIRDPNSVNLPVYLGMAQTLKAYYFLNLVDLWGAIPYSEAFNGDNTASPNINPKYDDPVTIYADLFNVLDAAIANFNTPSGVSFAAGDPIFGGDRVRWTKVAYTLKLRMLVQTRLVQSKFPNINYVNVINDILNNPLPATIGGQTVSNTTKFLTTASENMEFRFNGALTPDYRHPWFTSGYTASTYGGTYLSHQLMFEMLENKDPRWPYYFKRQTATALDLNDATQRGTSPCSSIPGCQYGYIVYGNGGIDVLGRLKTAGVIANSTFSTLTTAEKGFLSGLFGRDRADNSGAPADGSLRTAFGAYPGGGIYDDNYPTSWPISGTVSPTTRKPVNNGTAAGVAGNGIFPMITTSMVKFYIVEALLTIPGVTYATAPDALFETAIKDHIDRVSAVSLTVDSKAVAVSTSNRDAYAATWRAAFNDPINTKLDILWKQGWYTSWGNAIDSYNAFRRTGFPASLQKPLNRIRQFPLSLPLAIDELTLNSSAPQNAPQFDTPEAALFWDQLKFKF
ncbi:MAG: SusD/RagB family nutrient-binding outer membrane lipoprotein [Bacteroidetes bacterium]|nr:SusD/RagB family nutrient-binding outer membrane lipoprotein [Bacteroidota bacterium]MBS1979118.1 SusD/RagB family nutrient-binding outer membrane lipoprotein [Bacteroidota bacterium]